MLYKYLLQRLTGMLESKAFGECVETKGMHIGMENFLEHGPRAHANFVHA